MTTEIRAIESSSIHRIQSGQVIIDLCSVVKELVENSLDAGTTSIDVRFKNYGLDSVEVLDNGTGISKENYESLALKHYTSKLHSYEDLTTLNTFGFRGEALSSLCALAEVHILTATQDEAPRGSRLDFETSGRLKGTQVVAAQRGTLVVVENIFKNLPVRRQELSKNIKREYGKVLNLLQAYACISTGVKFGVSNLISKKKHQAFSTQSNKTVRENIANVFGQKTVAALTVLELEFDMQSSAPRNSRDEENRTVRIHGYVSQPVVGEGRQTPDRQMFFVNSRPCSLPQISKAMNEVYKGYNLNQSPFIFANLVLDTNSYDVNVSPDKRQILLHEQGSLLEALKSALVGRFDKHQQSVPQTQRPSSKSLKFNDSIPSQSQTVASDLPSTPWLRRKKADDSESPSTPISKSSRSLPHGTTGEGMNTTFTPPEQAPMMYEFRLRGSRSLPASSNQHNDLMTSSLAQVSSPSITQGPRGEHEHIDISHEDFDLAEIAASGSGSNDQLASFARRMQELHHDEATEPDDIAGPETPIRSIHSSPAKGTPGVVPNAFERMRPMRAAHQKAVITVGDQTTIEDIGRTWRGPAARDRDVQRKKKEVAAPQFQSSMRAFLAPGTQNSTDNQSASESDSSPNEEPFAPEWPRRGPNKPARGLRTSQRQLHEPRTNSRNTTNSDSEVSSDEELVHVSEGITTHRSSIAEDPSINGSTPPGKSRAQDHSSPVVDEDLSRQEYDPEEDSSEEWLDEEAKRAREDARVARMIREAEAKAARGSADQVKRAQNLLRGGHRDATIRVKLTVEEDTDGVERRWRDLAISSMEMETNQSRQRTTHCTESASAEERLTLSVSKTDFSQMRIVGQFNLGFILAVRAGRSETTNQKSPYAADELFIIDQHASDEKCTFEHLSATTILQSQRLVHPLPLELTAVEREIVSQHQTALVRNGFIVKLHNVRVENGDDRLAAANLEESEDESDQGDSTHAGPSPRATLVSLPASRETTFSPSDLEELLALLPDDPTARPSRTRRLLAMRACRSSVMIGRALTKKQMEKILCNLGELEKPWNCPHGRPTMRHVVTLGTAMQTWKDGSCWRGIEDIGEVENGLQNEDGDDNVEGKDSHDRSISQRSSTTNHRGGSRPNWAGWLAMANADN